MIEKIAGVVSFLIGILMVIKFPWIAQYQSEKMSRAGVLLGIVLIAVGIYLMKT